MGLLEKIKIPAFLGKQTPAIGLDIGRSSLKMIKLEKTRQAITLKKCLSIPMPSGADLSAVLADFTRAQGLTGQGVNISLSGQALITRYLSWPRMSLSELKATMQFEAKEYIPFPLEEMFLDCSIVKNDIGDNKMLVALAAVKKAVVQERISLLEKAGLSPKIIDVDCFCLANAFSQCCLSQQDAQTSKTLAVLNVGLGSTNMIILQDGILKFSRDIAFGAQESSLNSLGSEISSSVDYYENQSGRQIEKIYLSGGGCYSQPVSDFLGHQLGTSPQRLEVFSNVAFDGALNIEELKEKEAVFAVALGLALR